MIVHVVPASECDLPARATTGLQPGMTLAARITLLSGPVHSLLAMFADRFGVLVGDLAM